MTSDSRSPREVALMLIERESRKLAPAADPVTPVANAFRNAAHELSRWIGPDGCRALLTRALSRANRQHPALVTLQVVSNSAPEIAGVDQSIQANSANEVAAGLTTALILLFEHLGRLIGNDLTLKLAEQVTGGDASDAAEREDEEQR